MRHLLPAVEPAQGAGHHAGDDPARTVPYIHAPAPEVAAWRERLASGTGLRVGLVWAGNPGHQGDNQRSLPTRLLRPLVELSGATFYSLQLGAVPGVLADLPAGRVTDLSPWLTDFAATAGAISQLDLLISVDTAPAHLAGAMGKPVWLLLPFQGEWRWLTHREDSPWYPTMRIFRQTTPCDWAGVMARVADSLAAMAARAT